MADDLATLQTRLAEAKTARHALLTGTRVQVVARDGRRVEYTASPSGMASIEAYIAELEAAISAITGEESTDPRLNRRFGSPVFR